jgi:G3E family GTPase
MASATERIPLTVIGGYLGAGKTTVVNHVLGTTRERLAVLVNDIGSLAIDAALVEQVHGDVVTLTNGCLCCSVGDDLGPTIRGLVEREHPPERILVETSGVADPAKVARSVHPGLARRDGVLVVVDATDVERLAGDRYVGDLVRHQIACADVVVLNKTDLVERGEMTALRLWIRALADGVPVFPTEHGRVPVELLGSPRHLEVPLPLPEEQLPQVATWAAPLTGPVAREAIQHVLAAAPREVARAKALFTDADDQAWAVHRVGTRTAADRLDHAPTTTGLVAIAVGPGRDDALDAVRRALAAAAPRAGAAPP